MPGFDPKSPSTYIACLDIAVVICVLVVAGRPDGLAITATAVIVSVFALIYRRMLSVKAKLADKAKQAELARRQALQKAARKALAQAPALPTDTGGKGKSWLRGDD